jgi:exosome complex component CSL4
MKGDCGFTKFFVFIVLIEMDQWVVPGQRLGHVDDYALGEGTYQSKNYIFSSVLGRKVTTDQQGGLPVLSVLQNKEAALVPQIGNVVTGKVVRVNPRFASVLILCVGSRALQDTFNGIIRTQDVRATEVDKVEIYKSFRPGDIVRAEVISLGDSRSYFLSTAKNELGVVFATSISGATMIPVSWNQMQCPKTKQYEARKVAKIENVK